MKIPVVACVLLFAVLCLQFWESHCVCCNVKGFFNQKCDDDTEGTPCCGYGACNIVCCNCDGGCRQARGRRSPLVDDFVTNDLHEERHLSVREDMDWLKTITPEVVRRAIQELDIDGEGTEEK